MVKILSLVAGMFFAGLASSSQIFAKSPVEPQNGEIHLPSGAIVTQKNAPATAQAFRKNLLDAYARIYGGRKKPAKKKGRSKAAQEIRGDQWIVRLISQHLPAGTDLAAVCDEYVSYVLQLKMRAMSKRLLKLIIEIEGAREKEPLKCEYAIELRIKLSAPDGRNLPREPHNFMQLKSEMGVSFIASLSRTRRSDIRQPLADFMIIVPVKISDIVAVGKILRQAVKKITSSTKFSHRVLRFIVLKSGSATGRFRLPGLSVMAFTGKEGSIHLIRAIKYQVTRLKNAKTGKVEQKELVTVHSFNTTLAEALIGGNLSSTDSPYRKYARDGIYKDAREVMEVAGRYAASQFHVSRIVVVSKTAVPGRRFGVRVPINFERKDGRWVITNRAK